MLFAKSKNMLLLLNVLNTGSERTEFTYLHTAQSVHTQFYVFFYSIETYVRCAIYRLRSVAACLLSGLWHITLSINIMYGLFDYRLDMEKMC